VVRPSVVLLLLLPHATILERATGVVRGPDGKPAPC
jgi:hypothetical protein